MGIFEELISSALEAVGIAGIRRQISIWSQIIGDRLRNDLPVNHHLHRVFRRAMLQVIRIKACRLQGEDRRNKIRNLKELISWLNKELIPTYSDQYIPPTTPIDDQMHLPLASPDSVNQQIRSNLQALILDELSRASLPIPAEIIEYIQSDEWFRDVCGWFEYELRRDSGLADLLSTRVLAEMQVALPDDSFAPLHDVFRRALTDLGQPILDRLDKISQQLGDIDDSLKELVQKNQEMYDFIFSKLTEIGDNQQELKDTLVAAVEEFKQQNREDHAHQRQLLEQILARINELQPSRVLPERYENIPPQTACFVPKQQEIDALLERLQQYPCVALSGLGGIGKTQTAIAVARRLAEQYDYILWLSAEDIRFAGTGLRLLVDALNLPGVNPEQGDTYLQALRIWLRSDDSKNWLLVVDNADEPESLREFFDSLHTPRGKVLLTTRAHASRLACLNLHPKAAVEAQRMTEAEAVEFLFERTGKPRNPQTEQRARAIAKRLGYLPLAMEQAGAYLTQTQAPLQDYLQLYDQKRREWDQRYKPQMGNYPATVGTTWLINIEQVQRKSPPSVALLQLLAFFDSERIPLWLVQVIAYQMKPRGCLALVGLLERIGLNESAMSEALAQLISYSLVGYDGYIEREGEQVPYSCAVHRLVQEVVRDNLGAEQAQWVGQLLHAYSEIAPDPKTPAEWERWREMLPHLFATLERATELKVKPRRLQAYLLTQAGLFLYYQGRYGEAEPLYQQALAIRKARLGEQHPDTAISLNNLAVLYEAQGRYDEAEPLYQQALAIMRERLGEQHPDTATSLNNLAGLYEAQGRYDEAEPLYQQALAIRKARLGEQHPDTAASLNNLAGLYRAQGRYDEAEPLYQQALAIRKARLGEQHPDTAASLNNLAVLYQAQGRYDEAEPLYQQALAIRKARLGEQHPDTATSLNNLAGLYHAQGRYDEAEPLCLQALAIRKARLGEQHPDTAASLNNLAVLYHAQGRYDEAEPLCLQALAIRKARLGEQHPDTAASLNNLAVLYQAQGRYDEAEPLYQQALAIMRERLGEQHPHTATSLNNLAGLYRAQGRYDEAEPLCQQALAIRKARLGEQHPDTAASLNNLAVLYQAQGRYDEAEPLYQQALAIRKARLGEQHPDTATSLNDLAGLYRAQGRYDEAEPLYQQALAIRKARLGEQHPYTITVAGNYFACLMGMGKIEDALELLAQFPQLLQE
jgi:tetratricopeptide (TPR) repeat protein